MNKMRIQHGSLRHMRTQGGWIGWMTKGLLKENTDITYYISIPTVKISTIHFYTNSFGVVWKLVVIIQFLVEFNPIISSDLFPSAIILL